MNPQTAYDMLASAYAYLIVIHGDYEATGELIIAREKLVTDSENLGKFRVDMEYVLANLGRWQYIRSLERSAACAPSVR